MATAVLHRRTSSSSSSFSLPSNASLDFDQPLESSQKKPSSWELESEQSLDNVSLDGSIDIDVAVANYEAQATSHASAAAAAAAPAPRARAPTSLTADPPPLKHQQGKQTDSSRPQESASSRTSFPLLEASTQQSPHRTDAGTRSTPSSTATAAATTAAHLQGNGDTHSPVRLPASPIKGGCASKATVTLSPTKPKALGSALPSRTGTPSLRKQPPSKSVTSLPVDKAPHDSERKSAPTPNSRCQTPQHDRNSTRISTPGSAVPLSPTTQSRAPPAGMLSPSLATRTGHSNPLSPTIQSKQRYPAVPSPRANPANGGLSPIASNGKKPTTPNGSPFITLPTMSEISTAKKLDFTSPHSTYEEPPRSPQPMRNGFALVGRDGASAIMGGAQLSPPPSPGPTLTDMSGAGAGAEKPKGAVAQLRTTDTTPPRQRSSRPQLLPHLASQRSDLGTMLVATHVAQTLGLNGAPNSQQLTQSASMRASTPGRGERPSYVQWSFRAREPRPSQAGADPELAHLNCSETT